MNSNPEWVELGIYTIVLCKEDSRCESAMLAEGYLIAPPCKKLVVQEGVDLRPFFCSQWLLLSPYMQRHTASRLAP